MGGFFGITSKRDCLADVFFGTDYHSHLSTRRGGLAAYDPEIGLQRKIHNIENAPFRTKFEHIFEEMRGTSAIGCISDSDPQPLLVRSRFGTYAICAVGIVNNAEALIDQCLSRSGSYFDAMTGGRVNATVLLAAIINQKDSIAEGIRYANEIIEGTASILIMKDDGSLIAARDKLGRLPVHIGRGEDSYAVSFESFAYEKLGYGTERELGPGEIVELTPDRLTQLAAPGKKKRICSFLWTYYGYPTSTYEGVNVEAMRYRNGEIMAENDRQNGFDGRRARQRHAPRHRLCQRQPPALCPRVHQVHAHLEPQLHARAPERPQQDRQDEADPGARADPGQKPAVRGRFHRARHAAQGNGGFPVRERREVRTHALGLPAHHVRLQIPQFLPLQQRYGSDRPPGDHGAGGRGGHGAH